MDWLVPVVQSHLEQEYYFGKVKGGQFDTFWHKILYRLRFVLIIKIRRLKLSMQPLIVVIYKDNQNLR